MAGLYIKAKLRTCIVKGKKALFHCWSPYGNDVGVLGVVEYENGCVRLVKPSSIRFIDNGIFEDYDWTYEKKGEEK